MLYILDRIVIPISLGAFLVRLGNFFNSEINGKITEASFFLATRFVRDSDDMPAGKAMAITCAFAGTRIGRAKQWQP